MPAEVIPLAPRRVRPLSETQIQRRILVAINRLPGVRAARNNVGRFLNEAGRPVRVGLGVGSPDLVGIVMVHGLPVAFGLEVKRPGKDATPSQRTWHTYFSRKFSLCVATVHSVDEAVDALYRFRSQYAIHC